MASDGGAEQVVPPPSTGSGLFGQSGFMDGLKSSALKAKQTAGDLIHSGVEAGRKVAADPKTKQMTGQALAVGKQIIADHEQAGLRVANSAKHGDVAGVITNGLPLAAEVAKKTPIGLAVSVVAPRVLDAAIAHAPAGQQANLMRAKTLVDGGTNLTHLNISGIGRAVVEQQTGVATSRRQIVAGIVQGQTDNRLGNGAVPPPPSARFGTPAATELNIAGVASTVNHALHQKMAEVKTRPIVAASVQEPLFNLNAGAQAQGTQSSARARSRVVDLTLPSIETGGKK